MSLTGKPSLTTADIIANDGFWPNLNLGDLMDQYRIPAEYADSVIETGLVLALIKVNAQLEPVKAAIQTLGYAALAEYTSANVKQINGQDVLFLQYQCAVFTRAKAHLLQQFNTMNRKVEAENAAKESEQTEQTWLDESQGFIKAFFDLFLPDTTVMGRANAHVVLL